MRIFYAHIKNNAYLCIVISSEGHEKHRLIANNKVKYHIMSNYQFITANNEENRRGTVYLAITQEIETLAMSDTYGGYGQKIDPADAGDHCVILTEKAVLVVNDAYNEHYSHEDDYSEYINKYQIGDIVSAYDFGYIYDAVINSELKYPDVEFQKSELKGFNYWDGSNWATVSVDADYGETSHTLIEDEALIEKLNQAIKDMEFVKEGFGTETYKTDEYVIVQSNFANHFESYEIFPISEHEFLNEENN